MTNGIYRGQCTKQNRKDRMESDDDGKKIVNPYILEDSNQYDYHQNKHGYRKYSSCLLCHTKYHLNVLNSISYHNHNSFQERNTPANVVRPALVHDTAVSSTKIKSKITDSF